MNKNDNNTNFLIDMRDDLEREIITLTNILNKKKEQFHNITKFVKKECSHEWEEDNVDLYPEEFEGVSIKYCKYCLLSYNQ